MVQDPNFWKRFSTAVHADDAAKEGSANLKHSYVPSQLTFASASAHTPPCSTAPVLPPLSPFFASLEYTVSAPAPALPPPQSAPRRQEMWEIHNPPYPSSPAPAPAEKVRLDKNGRVKRQPSKLKKSSSTRSTHPLLSHSSSSYFPPLPSPPPPPARSSPRCPSSLSLNLSGRSRSHFRTWTTITANPNPRDSWLKSQNKKSRQRTWICWCFWLGLILLVAAIVVTVLVLRAHNVI